MLCTMYLYFSVQVSTVNHEWNDDFCAYGRPMGHLFFSSFHMSFSLFCVNYSCCILLYMGSMFIYISLYILWKPAIKTIIIIIIIIIRNTLPWIFNRNSYIFIQESAFENVVWKMAAILSRPQCGKRTDVYLIFLLEIVLKWCRQILSTYDIFQQLRYEVIGAFFVERLSILVNYSWWGFDFQQHQITSRMTHICVGKLGHRWFRKYFHYLNQCWLITNHIKSNQIKFIAISYRKKFTWVSRYIHCDSNILNNSNI